MAVDYISMANNLAQLGMQKRESDARVLAANEQLMQSQAMNPMLREAKMMELQQSQRMNPLLISGQERANLGQQLLNQGRQFDYDLAQDLRPFTIEEAQLGNDSTRANIATDDQNRRFAAQNQGFAVQDRNSALSAARQDESSKAQIEGIVKLGSIASGVKNIGPEGSQERADYVNSILPHVQKLDQKYGFGMDFQKMIEGGVSDVEIDQISQLAASLETSQEGEYFAPVPIDVDGESVLYQPGKSNQGRVVRMGGEAIKPARTAQQEKNQIQSEEKQKKYEMSRLSTIDKSKNVLKALDRARELSGFFTTGVAGKITGALGSESVKELQGALNTIGANLAFEELSDMRQNSPTGGALGGIALGELELLKATIASMDPSMGYEGLKKSFDIIQDKTEKVLGLANGSISLISTTEEYNDLPSGSVFIDRDSGEMMKKK